jgi:hypothetical protein
MLSCIRQFPVLGLALISLAAGQNVPAHASAPAISNLRLLARNSGTYSTAPCSPWNELPRTTPTAWP